MDGRASPRPGELQCRATKAQGGFNVDILVMVINIATREMCCHGIMYAISLRGRRSLGTKPSHSKLPMLIMCLDTEGF